MIKAPTRALVVEDIEEWTFTLERAARRAGASEVIVCGDLHAVMDALRLARFDVAILDVGLDPDDAANADGIKALEAIRAVDASTTQCVLITGWQGGDRMELQASAQQKFGVDWAYMKEKYEARAVIAKLTELLEQAAAQRLTQATPMANLCAGVDPFFFEGELVSALNPIGGIQSIWAVVSRLLSSAIPAIAMNPARPMQKGADGAWVGLYWSRALKTAIAVVLASGSGRPNEESIVPSDLGRLLPASAVPELLESTWERNVHGQLWELPGLDRDMFPG